MLSNGTDDTQPFCTYILLTNISLAFSSASCTHSITGVIMMNRRQL